MTGAIELSVIMPVFNAEHVLPEMLESLAVQDTEVSWELIVSDNGSTDGSALVVERFRERLPKLTLVDASDRRGPAHARNAGARAASGDVLVFCDADDRADPLWINEMSRALRHHRLVGGRLVVDVINPVAARRWRGPSPQFDRLPDIGGAPYVISANLGCHRSLFELLSGFDETFPGAAGEDVDFCYRARTASGVTPVLWPGAVIHYRYRDGRASAFRQSAAYGRASRILYERHPELIPTPRVLDDATTYFRAGKQLVREVLRGDPARGRLVAEFGFRTGHTQSLLGMAAYWRPSKPPAIETFPRVQRKRFRRLLGKLHRRQPPLTLKDHLGAAHPWEVTNALHDTWTSDARHLLGAGLLADADVVLRCERGGTVVYANPSLDAIVAGVIRDGGYSGDELEKVSDYVVSRRGIGGHAVVVNVGANIGTTALFFARRGHRVVAVEPAAKTFELLQRNIAANGLQDRVHAVQAAVTAEHGEVELVVGDNLSTSQIRHEGQSVEALGTPADFGLHTEVVPARPLDSILDELAVDRDEVLLVWSDTEGAEAGVIAGGTALWDAGVPLWVEVRPSALRDHAPITVFTAAVREHFGTFKTLSELADAAAPGRSTGDLRAFIDDVGYGRWDFDNILLEPLG
jgi:FkbM family methyltransferase